MTAPVSKFVIKKLCDHQGGLDFRRLNEEIAQRFTVAESVQRDVLLDDTKLAIHRGSSPASRGQIMGPDSLIVAKCSLRLCQKKGGECTCCDGLHLCRYYVCGDCSFGPRCNNPHSLTIPHNAELLKRHNLHDLTEKQLFQLLLQNDPFLLPEICQHYNKGNGPHGSCRFTTSCTKLHVCQHYFQGDCKFGSKCKRTHTIAAQGMNLFKGFSGENIENISKIYRNKMIIMGHQEQQASVSALPKLSPFTQPQPCSNSLASPASPVDPPKLVTMTDAERNEICLFFIHRHCSFKEKCARVHWHQPYRWQVLESDGKTWKDLVNMDEIEKAYCDPAHDTSCMDQPTAASGFFRLLSLQISAPPVEQAVDFRTMTYGGSPVRRLSTPSSASKPPHFILTTEWVWYWKGDDDKWLEYGQGDAQSSVTSQILEKLYLEDRDVEIPFSAGKQQYVLYFKDPSGTQQMYQQNIKHKTKREVRRRPRFVSAHEVQMKSNSTSTHCSSSSTTENIPASWDKNALPDIGHKLVLLSKSAMDFDMIERLFRSTMPQSKINNIRRIQNPSLWQVFQWQKEQMKKRNGKEPEMLHLFHGTDESLIEPICEQNFDWRMCGVHGTAYGKGSYFARNASYSDRYARASGSRNKIMFVALVLVGEYTRGSSSYVRPPQKKHSRDLYDSCVDSEDDPSIFVVFEKQQIYPEYVISYS
ncbi:protein mono-ADP-ribosyltransferase PARP12-like isoform 1-T1 [Pholidichthys leucotaenia]